MRLGSESKRMAMALFAALALVMPILATSGRTTVGAQDASPAAVTPNTEISGEISVGMVANPQMVALQELVEGGAFNEAYPNITVNLTVLPENEIRQTITQDVTTQGGQFDVFTIGPFEVPLWAEQGWLEEVGEEAAANEEYDLEDVFPSMTAGLTYEDGPLRAAVLRRERDDVLPPRPVRGGRAGDAGAADLGADRRVRRPTE
jgi:sorbitol/mannitol transport system substrate-binding protein